MIGHYTEFGKSIRENYLDENALEMFWFMNKNMAYGGRAAIYPLISSIFNLNDANSKKMSIQESCDIGCKDSLAVFFSCLLYTSPSPRDATLSRMPSSA
mgnify:CR=1 FL=1